MARIGGISTNTDKGNLTFSTKGATDTYPIERLRIAYNGSVGIGTTSPDANYLLDVRGWAHFCKVVVQSGSGWCDYVFEDNYNLMPLHELKEYIQKEKHLPKIPTTNEVEENDVDLGEMNQLLLKKVEELTLYIIEQNERIEKLENSK
ncbi:MAG: hypothetical protein JXR60_03865 [Bacteroidales bacterium]|nr:hypothetical protein [Bacteroidales bacterium]